MANKYYSIQGTAADSGKIWVYWDYFTLANAEEFLARLKKAKIKLIDDPFIIEVSARHAAKADQQKAMSIDYEGEFE